MRWIYTIPAVITVSRQHHGACIITQKFLDIKNVLLSNSATSKFSKAV